MRYLVFVLMLVLVGCWEDVECKDDPCNCEDRQTHEYDDLPPNGTEGGICYPNLTCNAGFVCIDHFCEVEEDIEE